MSIRVYIATLVIRLFSWLAQAVQITEEPQDEPALPKPAPQRADRGRTYRVAERRPGGSHRGKGRNWGGMFYRTHRVGPYTAYNVLAFAQARG